MSKEVEVGEYKFAGIGPDAKWAYEDTLDPSPSRFFLNHVECALLTEIISLRAEVERMRKALLEIDVLERKCADAWHGGEGDASLADFDAIGRVARAAINAYPMGESKEEVGETSRFYHGDGSFDVLPPEEVKRRRIICARIVEAAMGFIQNCTCDKAYKDRALEAPDCGAHNFVGYLDDESLEYLKALARLNDRDGKGEE